MISEIEQETSDIDWFFTNGKEIGFVASGGGKLPDSISDSAEQLKLLFDYFKSLPNNVEAVVNPNLKNVVLDQTVFSEYSYFVEMAAKGLFSYDKTVFNRFSDPNYHLVAFPVNPIKINNLPDEILKILMKTKANVEMLERLDISVFNYH